MTRTILLLLLCLTLTSCASQDSDKDMDPGPDSAPALTGRVKALRLTDQVSGWTEKAGSYVAFTAGSFFNLINGGAQPHLDRGLLEGIFQVMTHGAGRQADLYAEDFGSAANASKMYTFEKGQIASPVTLSAYGVDVATGYEVLGGAVFHAGFGSFYFKLGLTGYSAADQKDLLADVAGFLTVYETLSKTAGGG